MTILGLEKYHYILAGGKKFATFPNDTSYWGISSAYLALMLLHLIGVLGSDRLHQLAKFSKFTDLLKLTGAFLLLALAAYPLGNDVYLYLHVGLMNLSGVDPFLTPAGEFLSQLTPFVDWKQTSTYGSISQLLFTLSALATEVHPVVAVYGFKVICLVAHVFNGYLVWRIVPHQREKLTIAYLLCPLLLVEQVGSAHVDVFVCTSILLTAVCLFTKRFATAFLTLWAGLLAKTIPVIWMPLLALFLVRQQRWKQLATGIWVCVSVTIVLSLTVFTSFAEWQSLLNPGVTGQYQSSIHALVRAGLETLPFFIATAPPPSQYKPALLLLSRYTLLGFALFYTWTAFYLCYRRDYTVANLLEDMGWVTLVLMLYATSWLMPWYVSILYAIAVVIPHARLFGLATLLFGVSSSAMYLLQNDAGLRSLVAIGLPTLALIVGRVLIRPKPEMSD